MKCYTLMRHIEQRGTTSFNFILTSWPHTCSLESCICFLKKSGRKKKKPFGRPPSVNKDVWTRKSINEILDSFSEMPRLCYESISIVNNPHKDLCICKICKRIFHRPVLLNNCQHLFCASCIFPNLVGKLETEAKCKLCGSNISLGSISKATTMQNILENIVLKCSENSCKSINNKEEHEQVWKSGNILPQCSASSSSSLTVTDIYKINTNSDIPKELEYAFAHFAKLKMAKNNSHSFELPSGGPRATQFSVTTKSFKTSTETSQKTIYRRQKQIHQSLIDNAGPTKKAKIQQVALMLNSFNKNDKIDILKKSNLSQVEIGPEDIVSLKADCGLPWENMKKMIRFFQTKNVKLPSLSNQRKVAKYWSGNDLIVEDKELLFELKNKKGTFELKDTPTAYINDLPSHLIKVLDQLERYNQLTFEKITPSEIHIKIGGDHGGGSFKMSYQVANVATPNSKNNTAVFNIFEAKDYRANLKISLSRHIDEIRQLQAMKWREKCLLVFIFGDYVFLCAIYSITGATGRHCCLFCEITSSEMQLNIEARTRPILLRTLATLKSDYEQFKNDGGNIKHAKNFNNVIDEPLFDIPIEQEGKIAECSKFKLIEGMGPILKEIESVLQSCGVQRQAYHSCSFVGNHVHKMLKVDNIKKLCDSISQTVFNNIADREHLIYMEAVDIQQKFKALFHKYSKCDNEMNSCHLFNEENIKSFETAVCELMKFFRSIWPNESITPKMHLLENHIGVFLST
ncbi:uncharacterized protein LOC124812501 [Hydra vulgaris]|uniref:uncharacterized protein LOC124812501 n=1 Tax=Hydra vulgaris TaxID=6087 RepID=UPI0032EA8395